MKKLKDYACLYIKNIKAAAYDLMDDKDFCQDECGTIADFIDVLIERFYTEEVTENE